MDAEVRLRPVPTRRTGGGRFEKPISGGTEIDSMMILIIILSITTDYNNLFKAGPIFLKQDVFVLLFILFLFGEMLYHVCTRK